MVSGYRSAIGRRTFRIANYSLLALLGLVTLYPFWFVIQASFTDPVYRISYFWPKGFFYHNYYLMFTTEGLGQAYLITILRVVAAVPLMLVVTGSAAFALTRRELKGRKLIITYYFITMFVSGGLIPSYMLLKTIGLLDTFWVYVVPVVFSVWTMIVMKTSFQSLPDGLVEAALMDGANYGLIFFRIILPLSLPMVATLGLFSAVWHWNEWFMGAFYIKNPRLRPLQTFLRIAVLVPGNRATYLSANAQKYTDIFTDDPRLIQQLVRITSESMKLAFVTATTVPILLVYPFIQRYFIKGVLIGSIKG